MQNNELSLEEVTKRLDIIINLLLINSENRMLPSEKIKYLDSVGIGLTQAEIGRIVGKPTNHVGAVLSRTKKEKEGKRKRD